MRQIAAGLLTLFSAFISVSAVAGETYKLSGQAYTYKWQKGQWDGKHTFPGVYCTTFPTPEGAVSLRTAYFNDKTIYLVDVRYPSNLVATIAVSTIPSNQTAEDAINVILKNERRNEYELTKAGLSYSVSELPGDFGSTVGIIAMNPSAEGPFPLTRKYITTPTQSIESMSVHRLFTRGHDRFEVAVIQLAPRPSTDSTVAEMTTRLTVMADEITQSLQKCTASIPVGLSNDTKSKRGVAEFNRFAADLPRLLETDAASVMVRGMTIDSSRKICARVGGVAAEEMDKEAAAWRVRNDGYIKAATAALNEIGDRFIPEGGEAAKQSYFQMILVKTGKVANERLMRKFNGANPDNMIVPMAEQCTSEAASIKNGRSEFRNTPDITRALVQYMERKRLPGR